MDMYMNSMGENVDLDDLGTHIDSDTNKSSVQLRLDCINELGYALVYMDYLHSDIDWSNQKFKVVKLINEMTNTKNTSVLFWLKLLYRIKDEIENMC